MAAKTRGLNAVNTVFKRRPSSQCCNPPAFSGVHPSFASAFFSTSKSKSDDNVINTAERPRWSYTPPDMVAPVRYRSNNPHADWKVNTDTRRLDQMYDRLLGPDGHNLLTPEVRWLAVTHKSFDHGRRGYNERLALLGKRIVMLQMSLALINVRGPHARQLPEDPFGRKPFTEPALEGIENLTEMQKLKMVTKRLGYVANKIDLATVMQWVPKKPDDLVDSGVGSVLAGGLYAIVGAIALQRGGELAAKVTRERILNSRS
ncbi:MAG: hypothetical protein M4579_003441 [Chaenotheca gracillima]|nr:MAG: hypothetical protein M4579_003441 [Chaenotheca gracillima]